MQTCQHCQIKFTARVGAKPSTTAPPRVAEPSKTSALRPPVALIHPLITKKYRQMIHNIRIFTESVGSYRTQGSVKIAASARPMIDAARSLLVHGANEGDMLGAAFEGVSLKPVALHKLVKPYTAPRGWDRGRDAASAG